MNSMDRRRIDKWRRRSTHYLANNASDPFGMTSDPTSAGRTLPRCCWPAADLSPSGGAAPLDPATKTHHVEPHWCDPLPERAHAVRGAGFPATIDPRGRPQTAAPRFRSAFLIAIRRYQLH
jgi:hypothetical protein